MKTRTIILILTLFAINGYAKEPSCTTIDSIKIDIGTKKQTVIGWGVSISWWAHMIGNKYTEAQLEPMVSWMTDSNELNMNVFRYNISGGDDPSHNHMRADASVPGYKIDERSGYDWKNDSSQRKILLMINKRKPNAIYEAANYSPPYWMTKSGCSSGTKDGSDNLKDDYYEEFAGYLADCVKYYHDNYGITFSTISPINEPYSNWWKYGGKQEGCAFNQTNQERIIRALYKELQTKNMLRYTSIAAMDANSIDECAEGLKKYEENSIIPLISQINVHSYAGEKRSDVSKFAKRHNLRLWQSESGPLNIREAGLDNYLIMAERIVRDMNELEASVWCDWQYFGGAYDGVWSLVGYDNAKNEFVKNKGYYCRKQFSHFIKPGYRIVSTNNENTLSAVSPDEKELCVVIVNRDTIDKHIYLNIGLSEEKYSLVRLVSTSEKESFNKLDIPVKNDFKIKGRSVMTLIYQKKE